ncbi:MAG TPA: hypothetical protein VHO69_05730, partial [Phototrophicaceae bacterium]|nr:hypothetical protein [Phototrophicaceae bacterium]
SGADRAAPFTASGISGCRPGKSAGDGNVTNTAHMVAVNVDVVQTVLIRVEVAVRILRALNLEDQAQKLEEASGLLREEIGKERSRGTMKRLMLFASVIGLLALLVVGVSVVVAGDGVALATNTPALAPVATEAVVSAGTLEPVAGIRAEVIWPFFVVIAFIIWMIVDTRREYGRTQSKEKAYEALLKRYDELLQRKDVQDAVEKEFIRSALTVQDVIKFGEGFLQMMANANLPWVDRPLESTLKWVKTVTDGDPNEPTPVTGDAEINPTSMGTKSLKELDPTGYLTQSG